MHEAPPVITRVKAKQLGPARHASPHPATRQKRLASTGCKHGCTSTPREAGGVTLGPPRTTNETTQEKTERPLASRRLSNTLGQTQKLLINENRLNAAQSPLPPRLHTVRGAATTRLPLSRPHAPRLHGHPIKRSDQRKQKRK